MNTFNLKQQIVTGLEHWIAQRPGLEFANYGDIANYRQEMRRITKQRHDAQTLLLAVSNSAITGEELLAAFPRAFSGRLRCEQLPDGRVTFDYCTGQYWPTEYRAAACAVLAQALWEYHREDYAATATDPERPGDAIHRNFKRRFGNRIASMWFD